MKKFIILAVIAALIALTVARSERAWRKGRPSWARRRAQEEADFKFLIPVAANYLVNKLRRDEIEADWAARDNRVVYHRPGKWLNNRPSLIRSGKWINNGRDDVEADWATRDNKVTYHRPGKWLNNRPSLIRSGKWINNGRDDVEADLWAAVGKMAAKKVGARLLRRI